MSRNSWKRMVQWALGTRCSKADERSTASRFARLQVMRLEDRRVLSGTPWLVLDDAADAGSDGYVIDAGEAANDGQADEFHVDFDQGGDSGGLNVRVRVNGETVFESQWSPEAHLVIAGSSDADRLVVDFSQVDILVGGRLSFEAGENPLGDPDTLELTGGQGRSVAHAFDAEGAGRLEFRDVQLVYQQTEFVADGLEVASRQIVETGGVHSLGVAESERAGWNRITAETGFVLEFASPTDELLISSADTANDGDVLGGDRLSIYGLDGQFGGILKLEGDAGDTVAFVGNWHSGSHSLQVAAGTIDVTGDLTLHEADVRFDAFRELVVGEQAELRNAGGSVALGAPSLEFHGLVDVSGGGNVLLDAGPDGQLDVDGTILSTGTESGALGGEVVLLGQHVVLHEGALLDVSGEAGGGTLLIGGDFQGANPEFHNALTVDVGPGVLLRADAVEHGDGGKVIVWSDGTTRYAGEISVRGGATGGDGGFVEVSGKQHLAFAGGVDAGAVQGRQGQLLLDPETIVISDADGTDNAEAADGQVLFDDPGGMPAGVVFFIQPSSFEAINADVTLQATGDIFVLDDIDLSAAGETTFTLQAGLDIYILADITGTNAVRHMVFEADSNGSDGTGQVIVDAGVTITSNGGDITFRAAGVTFITTAAVVAGSGDVVLQPTTAVSIDVGTANAGTFVVTNADIARISTTGNIVIGDRNLASAMEVQGVTAGAKNLRLETGGDINDVMANTAVTTTGRLELVAAGIGTNSTFDIAVSQLALTPGTSFDVTSATPLTELAVTTDGTVAMQNLSDGGTTTYSVTEAAGDTTIDSVEGTGLDFTYTNTAGSIQVGTAPGIAIDSGGGNVVLSAADAISVDAGIVTGGGSATLQAGGDVLFSADGSVDVQAGSGAVTVVADADSGGDGAITLADGSFLNGADGAVSLTAAGNVAVSLLTTTDSILVESQAGSIVDADGGAGLDFQAATLRLHAASGAGTLADPLESQVGAVEGTFGTGGFALDNDGDLTVGGVDAGTTGITATAAIQIRLTGTDDLLQVAETIDSGGAAMTLAADQMQLAAALSSGAGLITLRTHDAAQAIEVGAGAADGATSLGLTDAELDFVNTTGGLTIGDGAQTAGITVVGAADQATGATITGGMFTLETSGDIAVDAPLSNAVDTTLRTMGGDITFSGAGSVTAAGRTVTLEAQAGAIAGNAAAQTDVSSQSLVLVANQGIGSGQSLETAVADLAARNEGLGAAGDIDIVNQGTLSLSLSATTRNTAVGGDVRVEVIGAGNDLLVAGSVESADGVMLQAADQIQFVQAAGVTGVTAGGGAQLTAGSQIVGNAAAAVDIAADSVNLSAQTRIAAVGIPLELSTAALAATSANGDVVIDNAATMDVTVTNLTTGTGDVRYRQTGNHGLTLGTISTMDGDVTIANLGGSGASILVGSVSADVTDDTIVITADGAINDAQADLIADLTAFGAELNAGEGIGNTARLETSVTELSGLNTTAGDVRVTNDGSLNLGGATGLRNQAAGGAIDVAVTGPGSDVVVTGTVSADGNVMLTAPDEIRFAQPAATLGVESVGGTTILDANRIVGNAAAGIDVGGNALSARSVAGVGTLAVPLETAVSQLDADGGTGGVFIVNDGDVIFHGTADGMVRLATDGDLSVLLPVTSNSDDVVLESSGLLTTLAGGMVSAAGDVTLIAGDINLVQLVQPGSSRAFIRGTGAVFLGTQTGTGLQLSSGEAQAIIADMLVIGTNAGGPITAEGFAPPNATTLVLRSGQTISSGSVNGAADVIVENLAIDAALGVTLETNVDQLAVLNRFGGHIRIRELTGDMTAGSVPTDAGTLVGITNTGSGNIDLATAGTLIVMQNLTTFGGRIDGDTGSGVQFAPGASARIIESGIITAAVDGVPPNLQNLVAPQITTLGEATVSGQFGGNIGLLARNYTITVDWMDGTVETFSFAQPQTPGGPVSFTFSHFYLQNPTGNSASPIPIMVTVADDPRIEFSINGQPIEDPGTLLFAEVPGTGIFGVRIDTTPDVQPLVFPPMTPIAPLDAAAPPTLDTTQAVPVRSASLEKVAVDERIILLRVLSPTGETVREIPLEESVLDDLPGMFSRLPDGHYRIYLKEPGEFRERLVLDVDVRQGKAVDQAPEGTDPNRDPGQFPLPRDAEPPPRGEVSSDEEPVRDEMPQETAPADETSEADAAVVLPARDDRQSGKLSVPAETGRRG